MAKNAPTAERSTQDHIVRQQNVALLRLHQQVHAILRMFPLVMVFVGCSTTWAAYSADSSSGPGMSFWNSAWTLISNHRRAGGDVTAWVLVPWLVFVVSYLVCVLAEGSIILSPRRIDPSRELPSAPNRWLSIVLPLSLGVLAIWLNLLHRWHSDDKLLDVTFAPWIAIAGAVIYVALSRTPMDSTGMFVRLPDSPSRPAR